MVFVTCPTCEVGQKFVNGVIFPTCEVGQKFVNGVIFPTCEVGQRFKVFKILFFYFVIIIVKY